MDLVVNTFAWIGVLTIAFLLFVSGLLWRFAILIKAEDAARRDSQKKSEEGSVDRDIQKKSEAKGLQPVVSLDQQSETPLDIPTDIDRTRVHESGHALAAWLHPEAPMILGVVVFRNGNGLTGAMRQFPPSSPEAAWYDLTVIMAGVAAEFHVYGNTRPNGSVADVLDAINLSIACMRIWPEYMEQSCPWLNEAPLKIDNFIELVGEGLEPNVITWMLGLALWRAKIMMEDEHDKLLLLSNALKNQGDQLCESEIEEAIGPRPIPITPDDTII